MRAKARQHKPGEMNKNEAAYARELEERQRAGEIVRYRFEPMKFRLADLAFYTPDFEVQLPDGTVEFHEVKPGYRQKLKDGTRCEAPFCFEDAKVKIRVAAAFFDEFGFLIVFPLKAGGRRRVDFGSRGIVNAQTIGRELEVAVQPEGASRRRPAPETGSRSTKGFSATENTKKQFDRGHTYGIG